MIWPFSINNTVMESQKSAPWAVIAALAIGFSVGRWDGNQIKPETQDKPGNYFVTTFNGAGQVVVTNSRTGDVYFTGSSNNWQWEALPPLPMLVRAHAVRIDSQVIATPAIKPNPYDQFDQK